MKVYLQEPTFGSRRGIFRAEIKAEDGYGDYGIGYYYGWAFKIEDAVQCAGTFGQLTPDDLDDGDADRLAEAMNDFFDGLVPNRRLIPRCRWGV